MPIYAGDIHDPDDNQPKSSGLNINKKITKKDLGLAWELLSFFNTNRTNLSQQMGLKSDYLNKALLVLSKTVVTNKTELQQITQEYKKTTGIVGILGDNIQKINRVLKDYEVDKFRQTIEGKISSREITPQQGMDAIDQYSSKIQSSYDAVAFKVEEYQKNLEEVVNTSKDVVNNFFSPFERFLERIPILGQLNITDKLLGPLKNNITQYFAKNFMSGISGAATKAGAQIAKLLVSNPIVAAVVAIGVIIVGSMGKILSRITQISEEIAQELGTTFKTASKFALQMITTQSRLAGFGISMEAIQETTLKLYQKLGSVTGITQKTIENTLKAQKAFGLSVEQSVELQKVLNDNMGIAFNDVNSQNEVYTSIIEQSEKYGISTNRIANSLIGSKNTLSVMLIKTREQRLEFVKQVAIAEKLGKTLDDLKSSFSLFDDPIESTKAAMAISRVTGIYLDVQKLFTMRLKGDFAGAAELIVDKLIEARDKITDPSQYNLFMRVYSKQLQMSESDLNELANRRLRMRDEETRRLHGQLTFSEKLKDLNKAMGLGEKEGPFKRMWLDIVQLVQPAIIALHKPVLALMDTLYTGWKMISPIIGAIIKSTTAVIKLVAPIFSWIFILVKIIYKLLSPILSVIGKILGVGFDAIGKIGDSLSPPALNFESNTPGANINSNFDKVRSLQAERASFNYPNQYAINQTNNTQPNSLVGTPNSPINENITIKVNLDSNQIAKTMVKRSLKTTA